MTATTTAETNVEQLWTAYKANPKCGELRNRLVETYMPLVRFNAERVRSRLPDTVELDDLISSGTFGLISAIESFDLDRGVKFETFCVPRIRGAMLDELRSMDWAPRMVRSQAARFHQARKELEHTLGRRPTEAELAGRLDVTPEEVERMALEANVAIQISLHKVRRDDEGAKEQTEIDILEDRKSIDPTRRLQKRDLMRLVTKGLNRAERLILLLYYYEEMTMKEIGHTLGLSESRVSQMHSNIVQRLKGQLSPRRVEFAA
ncbi:MAG: FliA/WhiG family RNA polymerase sigma factor [Planctomycetes bacterium]|nr:FliA/WhiG family RNA polymerase sigma factor [Planctomycetota bacterium]